MSDNREYRASRQVILTSANTPDGMAAYSGGVNPHRCAFLRCAAMTAFVIPAVGAMARAGDDLDDATDAKRGKPLPQLYNKSNAHQFEQIQADENATWSF